ncbi:permease [uncultured Desulfuromusa sp.]|uniref:permease n=1 Tax=uncultured Desulfuromusa sp. TaxID=219183 RepID=UPI002AA68914|nr:permease [uncultured Desulfuromusa sp.]
MNWKKEWKVLLWIVVVFLGCFFLPVEAPRVRGALLESLYLVKWYAREHVLLCLVPAFFIAGAVAVFVSQSAVMKYLGPKANKVLAYGVASVSGTILAVCSCTILPLFAGIYRMGAGLGPACAFLYSGPAINILAIVLTARILGPEMGIARAIGAIVFAIIIGLAMHFLFRHEEEEKAAAAPMMGADEGGRPLWQTALYFAAMVGILVFANWGKTEETGGLWHDIYAAKWIITSGFSVALAIMLATWFRLGLVRILLASLPALISAIILPHQPALAFTFGVIGLSTLSNLKSTRDGEMGAWFNESWDFAKKILPLLLIGVLIAGVLLGRPGHEGLIPSTWVASLVGGNSLFANMFASVFGAFMYFATLTEVPILQGLMGAGMGKGPALALLLAGPALSLPNMLVIRSVMGTKKTLVFVLLVMVMATISGLIYGTIF